MPDTAVDFRAPPPSPVASGRRSSVTNDDVLTEFLEASVRVPDLVLPDKIFPKQKHHETPAKVDFVSLCFHQDEALRDVVWESMARTGCFQLVNHGIPRELIASAAEGAARIFEVPAEKRAAATRSAEKPWGFEEYEESSEEFVWCRDEELHFKMEGICPIGYPNFSKQMETLALRVDTVAEKILSVIVKSFANASDSYMPRESGTLCCVYKHRQDQDNNSLKYHVIRMLIKGTDYSHSLCFHACHGSSEFHLYSKKSWLSFCPEEQALIITAGDQTQILSRGHYKHVIGRPVFKGEKEDNISMAFLYPTQTHTKNNFQINGGRRTISFGQQAILAMILTLAYHVLIYVYKKL